jgi:hypothetical protein
MRPALHGAARLVVGLYRVSSAEQGFTNQATIARALAERRVLQSVYSTFPFRIRLGVQRYASREDG